MAKANWVKVSPSQGSGNAMVNVVAGGIKNPPTIFADFGGRTKNLFAKVVIIIKS